MQYKQSKKYILSLICVIIIILSISYIIHFFIVRQDAINERNLLNDIEIDNKLIEENDSSNDNENKKNSKSKETIERMAKIRKLKKQNNDIVGWIEIKNTNISYPVLQCDDNNYYLTHNYKKEKTKKGSIFLNKNYDWNKPSCNLLIYGHNIKNGQMFQDLLKYEKKEFYYSHPNIRFTTVDKDYEYEIISVFKSKVYYKNQNNVFKYYNFTDANSKDEYNDFIKSAKKASLYDTGITAKYGEQLITLITCSYHTDDGRFVVIGKKKIFRENKLL